MQVAEKCACCANLLSYSFKVTFQQDGVIGHTSGEFMTMVQSFFQNWVTLLPPSISLGGVTLRNECSLINDAQLTRGQEYYERNQKCWQHDNETHF